MNSAINRRCFIVMSGKSTRGLADRFCGWTDPPLSPEGRQQILTCHQDISVSAQSLPRIGMFLIVAVRSKLLRF